MAAWAERRLRGQSSHPVVTEVLPVNGSREALFGLRQASVDSQPPWPPRLSSRPNLVLPEFYEGAALLAGARPFLPHTLCRECFRMDWSRVPDDLWEQVNLAYVCSPGNPIR